MIYLAIWCILGRALAYAVGEEWLPANIQARIENWNAFSAATILFVMGPWTWWMIAWREMQRVWDFE